MDQLQYFRTTKVAILFNNQAEHKAILQFFGLQRPPLTIPGACSVFRYKAICQLTMTYTYHPLPLFYFRSGYTIIDFEDFRQVTGEDPIPGITGPIREISEIMAEADRSIGDLRRISALWKTGM